MFEVASSSPEVGESSASSSPEVGGSSTSTLPGVSDVSSSIGVIGRGGGGECPLDVLQFLNMNLLTRMSANMDVQLKTMCFEGSH